MEAREEVRGRESGDEGEREKRDGEREREGEREAYISDVRRYGLKGRLAEVIDPHQFQ